MLVSVEVVINVCWLVLRPPSTKTLCYPTTDYKVRICGGLDDYSYIVGLIYPLILVVFCTIYAIKTRKVRPRGAVCASLVMFTGRRSGSNGIGKYFDLHHNLLIPLT
uniref:G-protein coupled receptors family 3 profile domain-containing protein n=1 Tax=Scylla olivacea TaxID=85551 RepID=A0A0P4WJ81_SCYOL